MRGEARQVASEGTRDTKQTHRGGSDGQIQDGRLLGGACDEPGGGAAEGDCGAEGGDAEKQRQSEARA